MRDCTPRRCMMQLDINTNEMSVDCNRIECGRCSASNKSFSIPRRVDVSPNGIQLTPSCINTIVIYDGLESRFRFDRSLTSVYCETDCGVDTRSTPQKAYYFFPGLQKGWRGARDVVENDAIRDLLSRHTTAAHATAWLAGLPLPFIGFSWVFGWPPQSIVPFSNTSFCNWAPQQPGTGVPGALTTSEVDSPLPYVCQVRRLACANSRGLHRPMRLRQLRAGILHLFSGELFKRRCDLSVASPELRRPDHLHGSQHGMPILPTASTVHGSSWRRLHVGGQALVPRLYRLPDGMQNASLFYAGAACGGQPLRYVGCDDSRVAAFTGASVPTQKYNDAARH